MQTLYVKDRDEKGKENLRPVKIIRAWQDSDGRQVFLHHTGVYGYKDGSPVRGEAEFDIITAETQKKLALNWWKKIGRRMSEEHYQQKAAEDLDRQTRGVPTVVDGDVSDLDMVLYRRRPLKGKRVFGDPQTWYAWFEARPDWWGHAAIIEISGYRYERTELADDEEAAEGAADDAQDEAMEF